MVVSMTHNCTVRIITQTKDGESCLDSTGIFLPRGNGFTLSYRTEGAPTEIVFENREILMRRKGNVTLFARFSEGNLTELAVEEGGKSGTIPVRTVCIGSERTARQIHIILDYDLLFESIAHFHLDIMISVSEGP